MTEQTQRRRPPAGVIVIASGCLLIAAAAALAAIAAFPFGFTVRPYQRVFLALAFTVSAVVFGAIGYDLLQLGEFGRRAMVILFVLQAIIRGVDLLFDRQDMADDLASFLVSVIGAIYLTRPNVKRAFKPRAADGSR